MNIAEFRKVEVRPRKKRNFVESGHQQSFFKLLALKYPWLRPFAFSIPNGGKRNPKEAKRLVSEGLTKGALDCMIAYPSGKYYGLFIEFKTEKGSLTKEQREMMFRLLSVGYKCYVCRSYIEALEKVEDYLEIFDSQDYQKME